jgi:EAL domain-containing protein (putative c-di-GMP-specific phosphodiesterase class I)
VIAEGVETEAQLAFLRTLHCDEFQGFYLHRPLPESEMDAVLTRSKLQAPSAQGERVRLASSDTK